MAKKGVPRSDLPQIDESSATSLSPDQAVALMINTEAQATPGPKAVGPSILVDFTALNAWTIIQTNGADTEKTSDDEFFKFQDTFLGSEVDQFTEDRMLNDIAREAIASVSKDRAEYNSKKQSFITNYFETSLRELTWNEIFIFEGLRIGIEIASHQEVDTDTKQALDDKIDTFSDRAVTELLGGAEARERATQTFQNDIDTGKVGATFAISARSSQTYFVRELLRYNGISELDWHRKKTELFGRDLLIGAFKYEDYDNLGRFWINPRDRVQFEYGRKKLEKKHPWLARDPINDPIPDSYIRKLDKISFPDTPESRASAPFRAVEAWERLKWREVREMHRGLYIQEVKQQLARNYPGGVPSSYSMRDIKLRYDDYQELYDNKIKPLVSATTKTSAIQAILEAPENKDFLKVYQPPTAQLRSIAFTIRPLAQYRDASIFNRRLKEVLDVIKGMSSDKTVEQLTGDAMLAFKFSSRSSEQLNKDSGTKLDEFMNRQSNTSLILYRLYQLALAIQDSGPQFTSTDERDAALKNLTKTMFSEVIQQTTSDLLNNPELLYSGDQVHLTFDDIITGLAAKKVSALIEQVRNDDPLKDFKIKVLSLAGFSMQDVAQRRLLGLASRLANQFIDSYTVEKDITVTKDGKDSVQKIAVVKPGVDMAKAVATFMKSNPESIDVIATRVRSIDPFEKDKKLAALAFPRGLYYDTSNVGQVFAENTKRLFKDFGLQPWHQNRSGEDNGVSVVEVMVIESKQGDSLISLYDSQIDIQDQMRAKDLNRIMAKQIEKITNNVALQISLRVNGQVQSVDPNDRADFLFQRGKYAQKGDTDALSKEATPATSTGASGSRP
jgi:hypothetical protein